MGAISFSIKTLFNMCNIPGTKSVQTYLHIDVNMEEDEFWPHSKCQTDLNCFFPIPVSKIPFVVLQNNDL